MTWVKLDDGFPENQKVAPLGDRAFRVYVSAVCYSARNLTDGFVPASVLKGLGCSGKVAVELILAGLFDPHKGKGAIIHNYLKYNPSASLIKQKRAEDSERKKGGVQPESIAATRARDPVPGPVPRKEEEEEAARWPKKNDPIFAELVEAYESTLGLVPPILVHELGEVADSLPREQAAAIIHEAFSEAAGNNGRSWKYVRAIFTDWQAKNWPSKEARSAEKRVSKLPRGQHTAQAKEAVATADFIPGSGYIGRSDKPW